LSAVAGTWASNASKYATGQVGVEQKNAVAASGRSASVGT
jgi:hypothetical protein